MNKFIRRFIHRVREPERGSWILLGLFTAFFVAPIWAICSLACAVFAWYEYVQGGWVNLWLAVVLVVSAFICLWMGWESIVEPVKAYRAPSDEL